MESLNFQVVAVLMPLEIKHHAMPHLKSLTNGQGSGSTFKQRYTVLKRLFLLNKWAKRRFQSMVAVDIFTKISSSKIQIKTVS